MAKKHIYCEKTFFDYCISKITNWQLSDNSFEELKMWMCIKETCFSDAVTLHLDITDAEIKTILGKKRDELSLFEKNLKELIIQKQKVGAVIKTNDSFVNLENINMSDDAHLTAYYLTCCDSKVCKKIMNDCGVLAICPDNISDFKSILFDNGKAIYKGECTNWNNILKYFPCNALLLIDNYILDQKSDTGVDNLENLKMIFDSLLPYQMDSNYKVTFQISFFTKYDKNDFKTKFDEIAKLIASLRPNLFFKLSIFKYSKDIFHDRLIITNNMYISCGFGFCLINSSGKSVKTTSVSLIVPFWVNSVKWVTNAYLNFIKDSIKSVSNSTEFSIDTPYSRSVFIGNKDNRLLK
ncbi:MAG: hypothetical protein J6T96_09730 [Bacteroidales bacterium]|nr:hypothetical protein [Bacteroidales bacterium]